MGSFSFGIILILFGILHLCIGVQVLLTVPKEAYYDAALVASVSAFGFAPNQKETVILEYRGQKDTSKLLNYTTLEFTSDSSQTWSVVFSWDRIQQIDETGVQLVMSSRGHEVTKALVFTQNFGYIFIQTDKPVYTPLQTVKYRVIAVDEYQRLAKYMIRIDIKDHKQVVVDRMRYTAEEAFKAKEFELPKDTPAGEWSITAVFEGADLTSAAVHTAKFEVKEYGNICGGKTAGVGSSKPDKDEFLPRFSSFVSVEPDVITNGTEWITVNVTSRYVYGRPVLGTVDLALGIWKPWEDDKVILGNYTGQLENGNYVKHFRVDTLFPNTQHFFQDKIRLYVKATVTESASLESFTYEDTSTYISHPYYVIDFRMSKHYFKPGFPYTFQAQVSAQNGRPASWVKLFVIPFFYDIQYKHIGGHGDYYTLDNYGKMQQEFDIPENAHQIKFTAIVTDPKHPEFQRYNLDVMKFNSPNNQYIHISVHTPLTKFKNGVVMLRYTKPSHSTAGVNYKQDNITVLVLAKGHIIYTTSSVRDSQGRSPVTLPKNLYTEITPSMRVVAYYLAQTDTPEFVTDSLLVDTPDVCLEEISLTPSGGIRSARNLYKPKDKFVLEVDGSPNMNVGFVAVDKAVFLLSDKPTLTRSSIFTLLGSHDRGVDSGDGSTMGEILENSGLNYITINLDKPVERTFPGKLAAKGGVMTASDHESSRAVQLTTHTDEIKNMPPQTVRHYFPETWLFEERKLPMSGRLDLNLTLPDSITTWSFLAVGISSNRGICVSEPLEQPVHKLFFADVRLPYKATRLEEVKVKIAVYNYEIYPIEVKVVVTGSEGLCFSSNTIRGSTQNSTSFILNIDAGQATGETVKVIPLRNGDLTLRVDLQNQKEKDVVEKKLYVIAEGQRVKKSITFVLDPEAKHATFSPSKKQHEKTLLETCTINNVFDTKNKKQRTTIDLAMPSNVIRGTESCRISAFGDLMGDIITHAVVESRSLIDTPVIDAEEVLGNLAPTIHALLSVSTLGLLDDNLKERGQKFVRRGITRLLKYRHDSYGFSLTPTSKPSTRLTAFVLKTVCHAKSLIFIDRENLINYGFSWLSQQINTDGSPMEQDFGLSKNSVEYSIMLSAEILIAILECGKSEMEDHLVLQGFLSDYLESNFQQIKDPMVMAKVTYALMLFDPSTEEYQTAVRRLQHMKKKNKHEHSYWSKVEEAEESKRTVHWFKTPAHASAIEATAYALMVFLSHGGTNVDAIADWLVGQRNSNGAFIGATDSTAAIQALSQYSLQKHGHAVDLYCNVSSHRLKEFSYSFKFTDENAIHRESLHDVPIGQVLDVLTGGHGLGQMQVNVEYNIPIEKNQHCPFTFGINVHKTVVRWSEDMHSNPLCASCDIGCPKPKNEVMHVLEDVMNATKSNPPFAAQMTVKIPKPRRRVDKKPGGGNKKRNPNDKKKTERRQQTKTPRPRPGGRRNPPKIKPVKERRRQSRAVDSNPVASKKSICVHICLKHALRGSSAPIQVHIEMLSGYKPVMADVERIKNGSNVKHVEYDPVRELLVVQFTQVSCTEESCVAFRAVDEEQIGHLTPANIEITQTGTSTPQCVVQYSMKDAESLQVYCADFSKSNRGECICYSGICSVCKPREKNELSSYDVMQLTCKKPVVYQLQIANVTNMDNWLQINSKVVSVNKTGTDNITSGSMIKLMSPTSCVCPISQYNNSLQTFYMLSPDVERLVDSNGNYVHSYLLDDQAFFLRVDEPGQPPKSEPSVPYYYLQRALSKDNNCLT